MKTAATDEDIEKLFNVIANGIKTPNPANWKSVTDYDKGSIRRRVNDFIMSTTELYDTKQKIDNEIWRIVGIEKSKIVEQTNRETNLALSNTKTSYEAKIKELSESFSREREDYRKEINNFEESLERLKSSSNIESIVDWEYSTIHTCCRIEKLDEIIEENRPAGVGWRLMSATAGNQDLDYEFDGLLIWGRAKV